MDPEAPAVVVEQTPAPESVEAAAAAAVEIAEIQAARDVELATINAETTETIVLADDAADDEDIAWLRAELADLRGLCATNAAELSNTLQAMASLSEQVASLTETVALQAAAIALQTPPPPSEPPAPEPEPPAPEPPAADQPDGTIRKRKWM